MGPEKKLRQSLQLSHSHAGIVVMPSWSLHHVVNIYLASITAWFTVSCQSLCMPAPWGISTCGAIFVCSCAWLTFSLSILLMISRTRFMNAFEKNEKQKSKFISYTVISGTWIKLETLLFYFCDIIHVNTWNKSHPLSRSAINIVYLFILPKLWPDFGKPGISRKMLFWVKRRFVSMSDKWSGSRLV